MNHDDIPRSHWPRVWIRGAIAELVDLGLIEKADTFRGLNSKGISLFDQLDEHWKPDSVELTEAWCEVIAVEAPNTESEIFTDVLCILLLYRDNRDVVRLTAESLNPQSEEL